MNEVSTGDIRDENYTVLSRIYSFEVMYEMVFKPHCGISPTDLDARMFIERRGSFLWTEFKTITAKPQGTGQRKAYEKLLEYGAPVSLLFIIYHDVLTHIDVPADIKFFYAWKYDVKKNKVVKSHKIPGENLNKWVDEWLLFAEGEQSKFPDLFYENYK